jgi:hypothetical protein
MSAVETEIAIRKVSQRMLALVRELELAGLDIREYSTPLAKRAFPTKWHKEASKAFEGYTLELTRITAAFKEIFKEEIEAPEETVIIQRKNKKRK